MKKTLFFILGIIPFCAFSQITYVQGFDGDPLEMYEDTLDIHVDTLNGKLWQIGTPQKSIFHQSLSIPNVIVTDTVNFYPKNDSSYFVASFVPSESFGGVLAFKWSQKLDMDSLKDGGTIQFSVNSDPYMNIEGNGYIYDFYGHLNGHWDSIASYNNEIGFTGTDTTWRQIWLCWAPDNTWVNDGDTINVKFQFHSDSIQTDKEGWMIDDMSMHFSYLHTVFENNGLEYFKIYPNPTANLIVIDQAKQNGFDMIDEIIIYNMMGREMKRLKDVPANISIDISTFPKGPYIMHINSDKYGETTHKVIRE